MDLRIPNLTCRCQWNSNSVYPEIDTRSVKRRTSNSGRMGSLSSIAIVMLFILAGVLTLIMVPEGIVDEVEAVNGVISSDTTWSSDTTVDGNILVQSGVTLTVNAGVKVEVDGFYTITIAGTIKAEGTKASPITFTSDKVTKAKLDWDSIIFNDLSIGHFRNCTFEYGDKAIEVGASVSMSNLVLDNCSILNMGNHGVDAEYTTNAYIKNNYFDDMSIAGVFFDNSDNNIIEGNVFRNISGDPIFVHRSDNNLVHKNKVYFASQDAIRLIQAKNNNITWNYLRSPVYDGVSITGNSPGNRIANNTVISAQRRGIRTLDSDFTNITGNFITSCGSLYGEGGIYLEDSNYNDVTWNDIWDSVENGISIFKDDQTGYIAQNRIEYNSINNSGDYGIWANVTLQHIYEQNILRSNNKGQMFILGSKNIQISNNSFNTANLEQLQFYSTNDALVFDNYIGSTANDGISLVSCMNFTIEKNDIVGVGQVGIRISDSDNIHAYDNDLDLNTMGVAVLGSSDNARIQANVIENSSTQGILISAQNMNIHQNVLINNTNNGIFLQNAGGIDLFDNVCYDNGNGMLINNTDNLWLWDNVFRYNMKVGLVIEKDSNSIISLNDSSYGNGLDDLKVMQNSNIEAHNFSLDHSKVQAGGISWIDFYYFLHCQVVDENLDPKTANISVENSFGYSRQFQNRDNFVYLDLFAYREDSGSTQYNVPYKVTARDGSAVETAFMDIGNNSDAAYLQLKYPPTDLGLPASIIFNEGEYYTIDLGGYVTGSAPMTVDVDGGTNVTYDITGAMLTLNVTGSDENWNGEDSISLTFRGGNGLELNHNVNITIDPVNDEPWIDPPIDEVETKEGEGGFTLNLTGKANDIDLSYEGDVLKWYADTPSSLVVSGNNQSEVLTFSILDDDLYGEIDITIWLEDQAGAKDFQVVTVKIENLNDPPSILGIGTQETNKTGHLILNMTDKVFDPDDPLTSLTLATSSKYCTVEGLFLKFDYSAADLVEENVTVTVSDGHGENSSDSTVFKVIVHNELPPVVPDDDDDDDDITPDDDVEPDDDIVPDDDIEPDDDVKPDDDVNTTDSDNDGLPDAWENATFGDLSQGANDDPDEDGYTNLQEYQADTDPQDKEDKPGPVEPTDDDDDDNGLSSTEIGLIALVGILLLIIIVIIIVVILRGRKKDEEPAKEEPESLVAEVEEDDVFDQKKIATAIGKATPMTSGDAGGEVEGPGDGPDTAPEMAVSPVGTGDMPDMEAPEMMDISDKVALGGGAIDSPSQAPMPLALPPAKIFEAEFSGGPRIDELFMMTRDGLLLKHFSYKETSVVDEDILASMLTVVQNFVADSFNKKQATLKKLEFGEFNILITSGEHISVVAISADKNIDELEKPINLMLREFEETNEQTLESWNGDKDCFIGLEGCIDKLVHGGYE